jgi:2-polyprenyl-3-methyl-5-hydroxy-6-metoxy-1,4-benzoquinol methylase
MAKGIDIYAALSRMPISATQKSGRYGFQIEDETRIVADIESKLALSPKHTLLEIGCGPGNLTIPLSFRVRHVTGMDHPDIIEACRSRFNDKRVTWLPGQFPETKPAGLFDRVLVYSVIHYLDDLAHVQRFIQEAASLLRPEGRLLVGDIPNSDRKMRFRESSTGKIFEEEWRTTLAASDQREVIGPASRDLVAIGTLADAEIMELLRVMRSAGMHSYVMPQPTDLPMGHSREDILIIRP